MYGQPYQDASTAAYRAPNPSISSSSRGGYNPSDYFGPSTTTADALSSNGLNSPAYSAPRLYHQDSGQSRAGLTYADMPPVTSHTPTGPADAADAQPPRKRRRSLREGPDWEKFYQNGIPKEVIVIHDTPDPEAPAPAPAPNPAVHDASSLSRTLPLPLPLPLPVPSSAGTGGVHLPGYDTLSSGLAAHHVAKKRKRDLEPPRYDPVYHNIYAGSHTPATQHHRTSPGKSTVSSDRTTSAVQSTAATSLESLSSTHSLALDYYGVNAGQKRKRTTRQQVAQETRRRQEEQGDACLSYRPPPHPPKKVLDVVVKVIPDHTYAQQSDYDDEDGHYNVVPGHDLTEHYKIVRLLGQGTFGKVVQAEDRRRRGHFVAIKVIRSVQKYRDASKIELRVLATLKANDAANRNRCIHFRECFDYRNHICIVMDLLGQSVFDFLKGNHFVPFPNSQIQNFARQLFTSVAFLHDLKLIHTDLKPENILLCKNQYQTFTYNRRIPSSSTTVGRTANTRRVLLDTEIRLIDFGSATFQDEYHSSVVSTRHYRAPEIILGLGWSYPCDIWSIGCILVEFFTGDALFQTHDNLEHLAMIEAVVGHEIDRPLVAQVNRMKANGGNPASKYFKRQKLDYPQADTNKASRKFVKAMKRLDDIIIGNGEYIRLFVDLLKKIFVYDPTRRITAKEALQHPWFKLVCAPDDGTEAVKIRHEQNLQREREERIMREGQRLAPIHIL